MVALGIEQFKLLEAERALRKTFAADLSIHHGQNQEHDGNAQIICQQCSTIFSDSEDDRWQLDIGNSRELSNSAENGCALCILFKATISSIPSTRSDSLDRFLVSIDWYKSRLVFEQCINGYSRRRRLEEPVVHAELDMLVGKGDPASSVITGRPDIKDFLSDETWGIIRHWLHECTTSEYHTTCRTNLKREIPLQLLGVDFKKKVPLRLLDVGNEGDIQITLSEKHKTVDYIALSYCWGGSQDVVLTVQDLAQSVCTFDVHALPKTIQDAIVVTRKLGMRYLWIDALCIIQRGDGGKDFRSQGPKMDDIYGSAFLTIAAASSRSVGDGFLRSCEARGNKDSAVHLPYRLGEEQHGTITISSRNRTREYKAEPLLSRCWTLQERILSQRVLTFHRNHLTWNCRNRHYSSDGLFWPTTDLIYLLPSIIPQEFFTPTKKPTTKIPKFWRLCVEDYSSRFRSIETDKLTALAGVARRIHQQTGDVYLAGLWKSDIKMQLCWRTAVDGSSSQRLVIPSCYLAPSWSWASLDSRIEFFDVFDNTWCWRAQLLDVNITLLRKSSPFSEVTGGRLVFRGQLKRASTMDDHDELMSKWIANRNVDHVAQSGSSTLGHGNLAGVMDVGRAVEEGQSCGFFWLWMFSSQSVTFLLLLKATDDEAVFTRAGSVELKVGEMEFKWFHDAAVQTLTVI